MAASNILKKWSESLAARQFPFSDSDADLPVAIIAVDNYLRGIITHLEMVRKVSECFSPGWQVSINPPAASVPEGGPNK